MIIPIALARHRHQRSSLPHADPGAYAWQTFRYVTFPSLRTAIAAGALLACALAFDEIIVTTFTIGAGEEILPIWIFRNLFRPNQLPIVDAVAVILILLSIIPVYAAHRLSSDEGGWPPESRAPPQVICSFCRLGRDKEQLSEGRGGAG